MAKDHQVDADASPRPDRLAGYRDARPRPGWERWANRARARNAFELAIEHAAACLELVEALPNSRSGVRRRPQAIRPPAGSFEMAQQPVEVAQRAAEGFQLGEGERAIGLGGRDSRVHGQHLLMRCVL